MSWSTTDIDFERALGESVKRGDIVVVIELEAAPYLA